LGSPYFQPVGRAKNSSERKFKKNDGKGAFSTGESAEVEGRFGGEAARRNAIRKKRKIKVSLQKKGGGLKRGRTTDKLSVDAQKVAVFESLKREGLLTDSFKGKYREGEWAREKHAAMERGVGSVPWGSGNSNQIAGGGAPKGGRNYKGPERRMGRAAGEKVGTRKVLGEKRW